MTTYSRALISATTKEETKGIHKDDVPIVVFFKIEDGNEDFLK